MALVLEAEFGALPGAMREMQMYLDLEPEGAQASRAREKVAGWDARIKELIKKGATVRDDLPFIITPDMEDW